MFSRGRPAIQATAHRFFESSTLILATKGVWITFLPGSWLTATMATPSEYRVRPAT